MRPNKIERRKELELAVALRQKELEGLRRRKAELEEELSITPQNLTSGDLSAAFPVLDYCGARPRKDLRTVPIERVGNMLTQFELASKAISERNQALMHEVNELNRRIKAQGKHYIRVSEQTKNLEDATGVRAQGGDQASERRAFLRQNETDVTPQELESRKALILKEIRTGRILLKKKEQTIFEMTNAVQLRREILDEIDALNNGIRVTDRDLKCEKEALQALIAEHDDVDAKLNKAMIAKESSSRLLIQEGIAEMRDEISGTVTESRQRQERVIKTQNYRIEQLEHRLECIEKALQNNNLLHGVDAALSQSWAAKGDLMTLGDDVDMYDSDKINPSQERCHPAIYNLFLAEKNRLTRCISLLNLVAKEKEAVIDALGCKAEALSKECQEAIQELDQVASGAAYEEENQRVKAIEYIEQQRLRYSDLFFEKHRLKSLALTTPRTGGRQHAGRG
ncbi:hypothetical protein TcCL_ESM00982 [Trypanosoma cruzi]|nr:hypothetical protein TcCL_ESM00982 [Trypanosoma cruzi]